MERQTDTEKDGETDRHRERWRKRNDDAFRDAEVEQTFSLSSNSRNGFPAPPVPRLRRSNSKSSTTTQQNYEYQRRERPTSMLISGSGAALEQRRPILEAQREVEDDDADDYEYDEMLTTERSVNEKIYYQSLPRKPRTSVPSAGARRLADVPPSLPQRSAASRLRPMSVMGNSSNFSSRRCQPLNGRGGAIEDGSRSNVVAYARRRAQAAGNNFYGNLQELVQTTHTLAL